MGRMKPPAALELGVGSVEPAADSVATPLA